MKTKKIATIEIDEIEFGNRKTFDASIKTEAFDITVHGDSCSKLLKEIADKIKSFLKH